MKELDVKEGDVLEKTYDSVCIEDNQYYEIAGWIEALQELKNDGATYVMLKVTGYEIYDYELFGCSIRKETDLEKEERLAKEKRREEQNKAYRKEKYEELKKEFG